MQREHEVSRPTRAGNGFKALDEIRSLNADDVRTEIDRVVDRLLQVARRSKDWRSASGVTTTAAVRAPWSADARCAARRTARFEARLPSTKTTMRSVTSGSCGAARSPSSWPSTRCATSRRASSRSAVRLASVKKRSSATAVRSGG